METETEKNALVTGAAGFGGSNLTRALLALGYRVTGLDVAAPSHAPLLRREMDDPNFRYLWKSVHDIQPGDVEGYSIVAHLAAQPDTPMAFESPRYTTAQNIDGAVALLEAVRRVDGVEKLLFAGSGNEVGRARYIPIDEAHPLTPHNPYGFSKAAAELAMWAWRRSYGVPAIVMSTGVVIGPDMRREVFIFKWLWNALTGKPITVEGGRQTRDLVYIDDAVDGWIRALTAPPQDVVGEKFFIGSGEERSVNDLAIMCRDLADSDVPIHYADYRPGERGQREAFSVEKARRVLNYAPQTATEDAIRQTAKWVKKLLAE